MFTGTPDADGIIPEGDGSIGGVVNAVWSATEEAEVSFTAPCNKTKITEIE